MMKYTSSIGQNTGTLNAWKKVQNSAMLNAFIALFLKRVPEQGYG